MGDRCTLMLTMRSGDIENFGFAAFGPMGRGVTWYDERDDDGEGLEQLTLYGANYACCSELERAAADGFVFFGSHDAGGDYGPSAFAAADGKITYADTDREGRLIVPYGGDERERRAARAAAGRYTVALKKVMSLLSGARKGGNVAKLESEPVSR